MGSCLIVYLIPLSYLLSDNKNFLLISKQDNEILIRTLSLVFIIENIVVIIPNINKEN